MKNIFFALSLLSIVSACPSCKGDNVAQKQDVAPGSPARQTELAFQDAGDLSSLLHSLDEIAELERTGTWLQGMSLTESTLRENAGDYTGAVAAAYKEMSYAYGRGLIQKKEVEQGLINLLELNSEQLSKTAVSSTATAILAFSQEKWTQALTELSLLFDTQEEPDSFANWMILTCALEKDPRDRRVATAYKSIRARYVLFPEYWYRGARAFTGTVGAEFAEQCINSSPHGPFSTECRQILARHTGLKTEEGKALKTKREIEAIVAQSVNLGDPQLLESLLPLIELPDNPYTVYAVGTLRSLTGVPKFKDYFSVLSSSSRGRLAERLSYICRG